MARFLIYKKMDMNRKTVTEEVSFEGVGIHSGERSRIIIHPAEPGDGIRFYIRGVEIPASFEYVSNTVMSTDLEREGVTVKTVEHLLAVFHLLGISDAIVEFLEGFEVPIMDGSGYEFYIALKENIVDTGVYIEPIDLREYVRVGEPGYYIEAHPSVSFEVTYKGNINYIDCGDIFTYKGDDPEDIVKARTFCYLEDVDTILERGYGKGGSTRNVLIIGKEGIHSEEGLRYPDEPLRHKVFDLIGDIYLLGAPIRGKIVSYNGGHSLNIELIKSIVKNLPAVKIL